MTPRWTMRNNYEFNSRLKSLNTTVQQSLVHRQFRREFPGMKSTLQHHQKADTEVQRRWQCSKQQDPQWCTSDCQRGWQCSKQQDPQWCTSDCQRGWQCSKQQDPQWCTSDCQRGWQCSKQQDPQWCTSDCQNISTLSVLEDSAGTVTTKVHQTAVPGSGDFQFCDESHP